VRDPVGALQRRPSDSNCLSATFAARGPWPCADTPIRRLAPAWRRSAYEHQGIGQAELVRLDSNLRVGAETTLGLQVEGTSTLRLH
jgi:hypothetical protein